MQYLIAIILILYPMLSLADESAIQAIGHSSSFKCSFPKSATAIWEKNEYKVENGQGFGNNFLYFDSIDQQENKGRMIGNNGSTDVKVFLTAGGLTMLELTQAGNFIMTTIFPYQIDKNKFLAAMSRHIDSSVLSPIVSQNYGFCEIWN